MSVLTVFTFSANGVPVYPSLLALSEPSENNVSGSQKNGLTFYCNNTLDMTLFQKICGEFPLSNIRQIDSCTLTGIDSLTGWNVMITYRSEIQIIKLSVMIPVQTIHHGFIYRFFHQGVSEYTVLKAVNNMNNNKILVRFSYINLDGIPCYWASYDLYYKNGLDAKNLNFIYGRFITITRSALKKFALK